MTKLHNFYEANKEVLHKNHQTYFNNLRRFLGKETDPEARLLHFALSDHIVESMHDLYNFIAENDTASRNYIAQLKAHFRDISSCLSHEGLRHSIIENEIIPCLGSAIGCKEIPERTIKDYLYINMDYLETFIAQHDNGLNVLSIHEGTTSASTRRTSRTVEWKAEINGKLDLILAKLASVGGAASVSTASPQIINEDSQTSKNIHHMMQRENIFDNFLDHWNLHNANFIKKPEQDKVGRYVGIQTYFDFISLSRLEALSSSELLDFYIGIREKKFKIEEIHQIRKQIVHLKTLFPFDSFLTAEGVIVFMEDKHLRESKSQIGYKFNSQEIKVVGKVNRYAQVRERSALMNQRLDKVQILTLDTLRSLGIIRRDDKTIFMITPVAIYA